MQVPAGAIRDTVAAVFRARMFNRASLLQRIGAWLWDLLTALLQRMDTDRVRPGVFWVLALFVLLLTALLLARVLYALWRVRRGPRAARERAAGRGAIDPLEAARACAARGDYTGAAHALYAALLAAIANRGELELHESKTIGDYLRDLATKSSAALARFREFARSYEIVIYGLGGCDRERYERLHGLAYTILSRG